jgi:hypothetical protein
VDFKTLEGKIRERDKTKCPVNEDTVILCFDPGHTTGFAVFRGLELIESGEIVTKPIETAVHHIEELMDEHDPDVVVMESYTVYKWKAKQHGGSEMLTTRVIGCIETFCVIKFIPQIIKQPAHIAKGFCIDTRLKEWGFYKAGERHARDAIRHGCYFLLFGAINNKERKGYTVG